METASVLLESLLEKAEAYGKTTFELSKLKALETMTKVVTFIVYRGSVLIVLILFVLILSIGVSLWLGEWLGKPYYGFFMVAAIYFVAVIILHIFLHNRIKRPISDLLITESLQ